MDDIYFSDKKKKNNVSRNDPGSRRISSDDFLDTDYYDEKFDLKFNKKGSGQAFTSEKKFKVNLPDDDDNLFSQTSAQNGRPQGSRTPQGRPLSSIGEADENEVYRRQPMKRRADEINSRISEHLISEPADSEIDIPKSISEDDFEITDRMRRPAPQNHTPQTRTPQGARVRQPLPNGQKPVRMSREGSTPPPKKPPRKPEISKKKVIILSVIGVFLVFFVALFGYGYSVLGGLNYDDSITENQYVDESTLASSDDVVNILFVGSDARSEVEGQRSDTMMLFSIDKKNKKLKLTSFLRDSYVYIPQKQYKAKLNAAFQYGGTQLVMDTIEYNFGVKIDHYVMVDFTAFKKLVNLLGGITVDGVTAKEAKYMREEVKIKSVKEGTNKMNGKTALWYCRIRYIDNDFQRTQRQRKVISAIVDKALKTNPFTLVDIVKQVLPLVSTDISRNELLGLGLGAALKYIRYDIEQQQIPAKGTWSDGWASGQQVLKMDTEKNAELLKSFLYDKDSGKEETTE